MPPSALLDACGLYPVARRDTLLSVAQAGAFRPLWSAAILNEVRCAIVRSVAAVDLARLDRMLADMQAAFPDAMVVVPARLTGEMTNQASDRHVLAAFVAGRADVIVTWNLRHFPRRACEPFGIRAQDPDDFLARLCRDAPEAVTEALRTQSRCYTAPPMTLDQILERHALRLPRFVTAVRSIVAGCS